MRKIDLIVFDMAGTTVKDDHVVESCFYDAAMSSGLQVSREEIKAMQGLPKIEVIQTFWSRVLLNTDPEFSIAVNQTYDLFKLILEQHYLTSKVEPTEGTLACFDWLRKNNIKIALTTGFYRKVTNIILNRLGWDIGLDQNYSGNNNSIIDLSLTPDETKRGRPHPDMIFKAMELLKIGNPQKVVKIGDTPSDLLAGKSANCLFSLAVTNGTHSYKDLESIPNDGLLNSITELPDFLAPHI